MTCDASSRRACCLVVLLATTLIALLRTSPEMRRRAVSGLWLPYVLPANSRMRERLWDQIHKTANDSEGGVWHYKPTVHMEVTNYVLRAHRNYSSILDVAVNQGYMLARLARVRPRARHYGSDVSGVMVAAAQKRCPKCKIMQYDLARLFDERGADVLPVADVVIVSDVLNFMPWAGLPAYFSHALPARARRASQRTFWRRLLELARDEVVFSDHQNNPLVVDFLTAMNATRRWPHPHTPVWTAKGTARRRRRRQRGRLRASREAVVFVPGRSIEDW